MHHSEMPLFIFLQTIFIRILISLEIRKINRPYKDIIETEHCQVASNMVSFEQKDRLLAISCINPNALFGRNFARSFPLQILLFFQTLPVIRPDYV